MNRIIEEPSQRNVIKISNDLAWAQMNIKEVTINIFFMLLTEIMIEDEELPEFDFAILDIEKKLTKKLNRKRKYLDGIVKDLTEKNIVLYNDTEAIALCKEAEIINEDNILFLRVVLNPFFKDELLNLTREFTTLNLQHLLKLGGVPAKRMYMILKRMKGMGSWKPQVDTLKDILQPTQSQQAYKNFKARMLVDPIKQINNLEDKEMTVSFIENKKRNKVYSIEFIIKGHTKPKIESPKKTKSQKEKENEEAWAKAISGELFEDTREEQYEDIEIIDVYKE